jgi:ABC-type uncharacterized transport system substrate-binding protein
MMNRRTFIVCVGTGLVAPLAAEAQPTRRIYRIGVLVASSRTIPATAKVLQPFEQGLRDLGYIEGRNLVIEWREAEGRIERYPALAAELVALKVDLIVASAIGPALAAKNATDSIPIVFVHASDPVGARLVKSLAQPGNNVTGFASFGEATIGKQLELLREVLPGVSRLAVIHNPDDPSSMRLLPATREASAALKLQVRVHEARSEAELEGAFRAIERERPDALQVLFNLITYIHRKRIADFAAQKRILAVYGTAEYVDAGGLMSYAFSAADNFRRSVAYVDRILKGEKPGALPVQLPTKLELVVNLKTAKSLDLAIPQSVLLRVDRVIE